MSDDTAVFNAIRSLYDPTSTNEVRRAANDYLQDFRRQPQAWRTADLILHTNDAPEQAKLFAAQTFRAKILYDFHELQQDSRIMLRDTLLSFLESNPTTSKLVARQLCLAIADLLLQLPDWQNPIDDVAQKLGQNPLLVPNFLEFLTVLPQELTDNSHQETFADTIYDGQAPEKVLNILSLYYNAQGVSSQVQNQIFVCLNSWLKSGEIVPSQVVSCPLFASLFDNLTRDDDIFDSAVDTVVSLIHETQELADNASTIELIVTRLVSLRPFVTTSKEDVDRVRGFCRVFAEAGEWYAPLITSHVDTFLPIVDALAECAACSDLDVVGITFRFWWRLSQFIVKANNPSATQPLINVFSHLFNIIIQHLTYPLDENSWTAQENDDFKAFRHEIGDTLKECCQIMGPSICLQKAYDMVANAFTTAASSSSSLSASTTNGNSHNTNNLASLTGWQAMEAPLFAIRAMGATVDHNDSTSVLPKILELLPRLPPHPKIKYTAILVVARYTSWVNAHAEQIPLQLTFVSSGFDHSDVQVQQAAAQAMLFLCEDCCDKLGPYLPQLLQFVRQVENKIDPQDVEQITTGVGHVIVALPRQDALPALSTLLLPILDQLEQIIVTTTNSPSSSTQDPSANKEICQKINQNLVRLAEVIRLFPPSVFTQQDFASCPSSSSSSSSTATSTPLPPLSSSTPPSTLGESATLRKCWSIMNALLMHFGKNPHVTERACSVIRYGILFFHPLIPTIAIEILQRMAERFKTVQQAEYLWVSGKLAPVFNSMQTSNATESMRLAFEEEASTAVSIIASSSATSRNDDIIEDFTTLVSEVNRHFPQILGSSAFLSQSLSITILGLSAHHPRVTQTTIDLFLDIFADTSSQESLSNNPQASQIVLQKGPELTTALINGFVGVSDSSSSNSSDGFGEATSAAVTLGRVLAEKVGTPFLEWVSYAVTALSPKALSNAPKEKFITSFTSAMNSGDLQKVRQSFINLDRDCRKARERAWKEDRDRAFET